MDIEGINQQQPQPINSNSGALITLALFFIVPIIAIIIGINRKKIKAGILWTFHKDLFLNAIIIYPNYQLKIEPVLIRDNKFTFGKNVYIVQPKLLKFRKVIPHGFWFEGCSEQIEFDFKAKIGKNVESSSLQNVLENKFLKELANSGKEQKLLIILICLAIMNLLLTIILNVIKTKGA